MNEVKRTLRRMALYYLLFILNIIPNANIIPDSFPLRNISTVYLLTLCVCLVLYYYHRVTPAGSLSGMIKAVSWMSLLLILLRGIKYSVFAEIDILDRHVWYLYYIPMLLIPLFLFYISLLVAPKRDYRIIGKWFWTLPVTAVFIILILTNDLHQLVFVFKPDFTNWDNDYSYAALFYLIILWRYALYVAAIVVLVRKCRITSSKKNAWIIIIPFALGIILNTLLVTGNIPKINGTNIFEFPEMLICTVAVVLESCIQLGLIPTNTDYGRLFQKFSISAQITDKNGKNIYSSESAIPLNKDLFNLVSGSRIGEHTALNKMKIPGGYGFWKDDMTELDRLNAELEEAKEGLSQESELIRLRNELKEKQTKIEQRTLVYDTIAKRTQRQSQLISRLAESARGNSDEELRNEIRGRITLLGAYIKRYANLMLLSQESNVIEAGELGLSVSEVLRYLNLYGIPGEFVGNADCLVNAECALAVFEAFELLLETNIKQLKGVFVNLSLQDSVVFKLTVENLNEPLTKEAERNLSGVGVTCEMTQEDGVSYIRFTLPKGGEAL